jgi:single-strand DNA-binding protein
MASGYNRVVMVGNLTRDPELKQLPSGQSVCRLNIASNRQFRNRQSGDMVQEVCYVDVDVWGAQAESSNQYLQKGRQVLVEGRLKLDSWQDAEGNNRSKHSVVADRVVFLSSGSQETSETAATTATLKGSQANKPEEKLEPRNDVERELMSQLDDIKKRATTEAAPTQPAAPKEPVVAAPVQPAAQPVAKAAKPEQAAGSVAFKDEPPFQDDLPF